MDKFLKCASYVLILCSMLVLPVAADAGCRAPRRGPPGPPGPQGPSGLATLNYASSYGDDPQSPGGSPYSIVFDTEQTPPVGIVHAGSSFTILNAGKYIIAWTFTIEKGDTADDLIIVSLTPFDPVTFSEQTIPPAVAEESRFETISGQTLVDVAAGTVVELEISFEGTGITVLEPSIYFTQIAP